MGLAMNDIHSPSTNANSSTASNGADGQRSLMDLISDRDKLESELRELGDVLLSHNVTMETPLLTPDGFPRSDLDVPQIRTTRARIIWLRNDYKSLMSRIEAGLHAHHAGLQAGNSNGTTQIASSLTNLGNSNTEPGQPHAFASSTLEPPFAKVNSVVSGSPAEDAGLKAGDEVRRFGTANWTNHERLSQVAQIVQRSENRAIMVKVKRKEGAGPAQELELRLVPRRNWGGRGLLGCHLVPAT